MNPIFRLFGVIAIKNSEANEAIDETVQKAKNLSTSLDGAGTSADTASGKMNENSKFGVATHWLGQTLYNLTEKAVSFGTNLAKIGFGFNSSIESYQYSFSALLGDADKAKLLIADIQKLAKETPLGLEKLANNAVSLITTGTELEDIIPTLEMLGNLSLGDPGRMDSVVRAYTQIISKGGLLAQEMYQLGDAMVPIRDIMTEFGGAAYADGSWYERKMTDPTFKIPAEDMVAAFQAATAEGGKWHDYMYIIMDSFAGMADRLGEEGKETLGDFFKSFFDVAKSDVMPRLIDSLATFRTWISENQETLGKMADAVGGLVAGGFDMMLDGLKWMMDHGTATGAAITTIATAMGLALASAHPLAASVLAIAGGLALLKSRSDELKSGDIFGKYSEEELATLQAYIEAVKEMKAAEVAKAQSGDAQAETARWNAAKDAVNQYAREVNKTDGLMQDYWDYARKQGGNQALGIVVDLPVKAADGSESDLQTEINTWTLEGLVKMYADATGIQSYLNSAHFTAYADVVSTGGTGSPQVDGSHAAGLWRVPHDNYIARLHDNEMVLNSTAADAYRSSMTGSNAGRVESLLVQTLAVLQQIVSNTAAGHAVYLDTNVLAGQMAPALDERLGTISNRKGRRN